MFSKNITVTKIYAVVGYESSCLKPHNVYSTKLSRHELIYKLSGEVDVHFAGREARETADSLRFLGKGVYPEGSKYTVDVIETGKCIDIYFDTYEGYPEGMSVIRPRSSERMRGLFLKMQKLWYDKKEGYYHECMALLYEIFSLLDKENAEYLPENKYALIKPAVDFIDTHFSEADFKCEGLEKLCGISYSYLKRIFIARFGMPPAKYVTEKRISLAKDLLLTGMYSVNDAASLSGFDNVYYFSRVFKERVGMPPSEYKTSRSRIFTPA